MPFHKDEAPYTCSNHSLHDILRLQVDVITGQVGVDDILTNHGVIQLLLLEHITLDNLRVLWRLSLSLLVLTNSVVASIINKCCIN